MAPTRTYFSWIRKCVAQWRARPVKLTEENIKNGAMLAETLLVKARVDVQQLPPINDPGLFLADKHGNSPSSLQAEVAAKHIAILEIHKPEIIALEFFTIAQTTFQPHELFFENLSFKNEDDDALTVDQLLKNSRDSLAIQEITKAANNLHYFFRMEADELDQHIVARTMLWLAYLNSVIDRTELIGLDIPEYALGDGLRRLCGTNPVWAETLAWRAAEKSKALGRASTWAMIAGAEHWEWSDGECLCNLKDVLPARLAAYGLTAGVSNH